MQEVWWDDGSGASAAVSGCAIEPRAQRAALGFDGATAISTLGFLVGPVTTQITVPMDTSYGNRLFSTLTFVITIHPPRGSAWTEDAGVHLKAQMGDPALTFFSCLSSLHSSCVSFYQKLLLRQKWVVVVVDLLTSKVQVMG